MFLCDWHHLYCSKYTLVTNWWIDLKLKMRVAPLLVAPPTPPPPKSRSVTRAPGGRGGGGGEPAVVKREGARSEELLDHHYCTSAAVSNCSHPRQLSTDRRLVSTCLTSPLLFNKLDQLRKSQKDKTWKCEWSSKRNPFSRRIDWCCCSWNAVSCWPDSDHQWERGSKPGQSLSASYRLDQFVSSSVGWLWWLNRQV